MFARVLFMTRRSAALLALLAALMGLRVPAFEGVAAVEQAPAVRRADAAAQAVPAVLVHAPGRSPVVRLDASSVVMKPRVMPRVSSSSLRRGSAGGARAP
ncbi:MAG: hypothetical protein ACYTF0_07520 [Planctomycetota bacterium]